MASSYFPSPNPGLSFTDFKKISKNGFGDGHNSFAHSAAWFNNALYVGTTRCNLCMLKFSIAHNSASSLDQLHVWPVDCPDTIEGIYNLDRRAQIWKYNPLSSSWKLVFQSPLVEPVESFMTTTTGKDGVSRSFTTNSQLVPRDIGYRGMAVFKGSNDPQHALYIATWAPSLAPGPVLLRTMDGETFDVVSDYGIIGLPITSIRSLASFNNRLYLAPTGSRGGNTNVSDIRTVYSSKDPASGIWEECSMPAFGDSENLSIFSLASSPDFLYAGTFNCSGYQIWRTDAKHSPLHNWECVISRGAGRGPLNQIALSLCSFKDHIYIGSGIQNGGFDRVHNIGPAASTLVRLNECTLTHELVVGRPLHLSDSTLQLPLSGLVDGFGNRFNGYFWRMESHNGWLYLGTYDSSNLLAWVNPSALSDFSAKAIQAIGSNHILKHSGFDLWRSFDGENWLPVDRTGFGNKFNSGVRNLISSPFGLFVGTANPFGPSVATKCGPEWVYTPNAHGGLEIWLGHHD